MREFDLLRHVFAANAALPIRVSIPPGDDMGGVFVDKTEGQVLITVDQLADGLHVDLAHTPLAKVARKAITRNLSDIAAMAAVPLAAVVAVALPRDFGRRRATELFDHLRQTAAAYDCPLIGGDVSMWDHPLLMSVTLLAQPAGIEPVRREGAQVGDVICVTGQLGGSMIEHEGYTHHLDFEPRLRVARQLAGSLQYRPHCMIDLSDGLSRDLGHLCEAAGLAAQLDADRLPIRSALHAASQQDRIPRWRHALADGEDYELCFTVPAAVAQQMLPGEIDGVAITQVGRIIEAKAGQPQVTVRLSDDTVIDASDLGWEHTSRVD